MKPSNRQKRALSAAVWFATVILIGLVDYMTGFEISFSIFYLLPIALLSWSGGRAAGVAISCFGALAWLAADLAGGHAFSHPAIPFWNASVRLGLFLSVAITLSKLKETFDAKAKLVLELQEAMANIKTLKGLVPICAWCKKIRDDRGFWQHLEVYIKEHSEADFTHGICPACMEKLAEEDKENAG